MTNQKSLSLPKEWEERYWLKYIGMEEPLLLTRKTRDSVLTAMSNGAKYVQIKTYTIMVNSIQSIEPYYPPYNIPERPEVISRNSLIWEKNKEYCEEQQRLQDLWDEVYGGIKQIEE